MTSRTADTVRAAPVDHVSVVEQDVLRKGGHVIWINPPRKPRLDNEAEAVPEGPRLRLGPETAGESR